MFDDREKNLLRKALALYAGEHVVARVLAQGEGFLVPQAETTELTLLFFDIASFTATSEKVTAETLTHWHSAYADVITDTVSAAEGTFDTFVGDAGSAWWGDSGQLDHAERTVACARALLAAMEELNRRGASSGFPAVQLRIGVHTGAVALGNHGSSQRLRFCALGDNVNLAARLSSLPREHPIVISAATYDRLRSRAEIDAIGSVPIKGGAEMEIYGVGTRVC